MGLVGHSITLFNQHQKRFSHFIICQPKVRSVLFPDLFRPIIRLFAYYLGNYISLSLLDDASVAVFDPISTLVEGAVSSAAYVRYMAYKSDKSIAFVTRLKSERYCIWYLLEIQKWKHQFTLISRF